ncbi:MAG: nitrogenase component 1 [Oscillospiraceae bacterium]|nr:nitrogenase component 1 [Oscillospiraceae bacterium]
MLKRMGGEVDATGAVVPIKNADFPAPFKSELEYSCSARGTWNIVHTGFLVPEAHEIFACAAGCLRGVVLTAAEMNAQDRFSTIEIRENNVLEGDMEDLLIEGVTDILNKLPYKPRAVLLYTSCIHHFIGCDLPLCYARLRERFPDIDFTDCYMNPIMRKSGLTPDQLMRRGLYALLKQRDIDDSHINIIGNNIATDKDSELIQMLEQAGYTITEIHDCHNYDAYQQMASAAFNICYNPVGKAGGEELEKRLGQKLLYLPLSYQPAEILGTYEKMTKILGMEMPDLSAKTDALTAALSHAKEVIGETPITIDYTATMRPLSLARALLEHGFNVTALYIDSFSGEEKGDLAWLQAHFPELPVYATVQVKMRVLPRETCEKTLAIGQKAAYFTGTPYFVNIVECGGYYGFSGFCKLLALMEDAFLHEKDTRKLIQIKGLGCGCV